MKTNLERLIEEGLIWIDKNEYVGRASDKTEVGFGVVGMDEERINWYLTYHNTPYTW
jgi:hypothetical protein